jgi:hypothetical protein
MYYNSGTEVSGPARNFISKIFLVYVFETVSFFYKVKLRIIIIKTDGYLENSSAILLSDKRL